MVVRVRPTIDEDRNNLLSEEDGVECVAASAAGHDVVLSRPFYPPKEFEFDCVLGPKSSQESVYDAVARDIVRDTMQGFNATVMCYGQVRRRCGRATSDEWMHGSKRGLYGSAIACVLQCRGRRVRRTGTESCYRGRVLERSCTTRFEAARLLRACYSVMAGGRCRRKGQWYQAGLVQCDRGNG